MINRKVFIIVLVTFISCSLNYASEMMIPSTQISAGRGLVNLYFSRQSEDLSFRVSSRDEIRVGASSYLSDVSNDVKAPGLSNSVVAKYLAKPGEGLGYWLKAGGGYYELEFPSSDAKNKLSAREPGIILGAGMRKSLFPDTIVSPAVSAELGFDYSSYALKVFRAGDEAPSSVDDNLQLARLQAAVSISKKFGRTEFYGGLKLFRVYSELSDRSAATAISGFKDNAGLYAGARLQVLPGEALVIEAGALGETGVSVGWSVEF